MASSDKTFGVAFSGGGIRSAAFCSGVLRRLLSKGAEPDYLSCVSGGGYTGSAYVQWKHEKAKNQNEKEWQPLFFDKMRKNTSLYCNWQNLEGVCDSVILSFLIVFVAVIVPVIGWGSFACPIAFMVNLLYGRFVDGTLCREDGDSLDCRERTILFSVSLGIFFLFHLLDYLTFSCCENKNNYTKMKWAKLPLLLIQQFSGATFAFTFFPWFINDFLRFTHICIRLLVVAISAVFWFFAPVLRKYSSLVFLIYAYSYVVFWRVYKRELLFIKYTDNRFRRGMAVSLIILAIFAIVGDFPLRLVHLYNRWRLQKAFYYHGDGQCCNYCDCDCDCNDCFPGCYCPSKETLTLADLSDVEKPIYLSNMVVNGWRRKYNQKYCLLTMSPQGISLIEKQPTVTSLTDNKPSPPQKSERLSKSPVPSTSSSSGSDDDVLKNLKEFRENCLKDQCFEGKLKPSDIKLSSAMAMSAAALSPYLGKYESEEEKFSHFLTICGLEMAGRLVSDMSDEKCCKNCVAAYALNFFIGAMFVVFGIVYWLFVPKSNLNLPIIVTALVVGISLVCLFVVFLCICCNCCSGCRSCTDLHNWLLVHLASYRFICSLLNIITDGETPPAMMHLSDGGHFENMGLLPLLKLRLPYILVVDGSHIPSDEEYAKEIVNVMEQAREILDCSFTTVKGDNVLKDIRNLDKDDVFKYINKLRADVLTDIKNNYVTPAARKYEFKVHYSRKGDNERWQDVDEGHIFLIAPRGQPTERKESDEKDKKGTSKAKLHAAWGSGPYLTENDIDDISGCPAGLGCCDCCHSRHCVTNRCQSYLGFPRHATANQFFTPRMFAAYHREGYSACMACDEFVTKRAPANKEAERAAAHATETKTEPTTSADSREKEVISTTNC